MTDSADDTRDDIRDAGPNEPTAESALDRSGRRHAAAVILWLCVFGAIPYAVAEAPLPDDLADDLERIVLYRPGDPLPFVEGYGTGPEPQIGGAMGRAETAEGAALLDEAPLPEALPALSELPSREGDAAAFTPPLPDEAWAGLTRELEGDLSSMAHFYDRLAAIASAEAGEPDADAPPKARVLVYGTSLNGADRTTQVLREGLATHFGDGGRGFIPIARGWQSHRQKAVRWSFRGWNVEIVNSGRYRDGLYGLAGIFALSEPGVSTASFGTVDEGTINRAVSRFEIYYRARRRGGTMAVEVDGGPATMVDTSAEEGADARHIVEVPEGAHTMTLSRARGALRLYGVVMENDQPGTVVDAASLIGAYTAVFRHLDSEHWAEQIRTRETDLLLFWMGGNDAAGPYGFDAEDYRAHYARSLRRARAGRPEAACLVMGILDKGERRRGRIVSLERVEPMIEAQRAAASDAGCAFFDTYRATGGEGTVARWREARPPLLIADLGHLTDAGSEVVGTLLLKALLKGYVDHARAEATRE